MIIVIEMNLKEAKFLVFREDKPGALPVAFIKDAEEITTSKTLKRDILNLAGKGKITAISLRILFGGEFFDKATVINRDFFDKFAQLTDFFPFYIPLITSMLKVFYRDFAEVPQIAFFETAFFSKLPEEEKYYAIPHELYKNNRIKKWGFHGIFHEFNYAMFSQAEKCISIVLDKQTTVCSMKDGMPFSISLGFTPLEGVMSRTSCGELDPGIVFYLMNVHGFSIYKIDDILKNESGFFGLTGYDLELKELIKFYGKDPKVDLAFDIYQAQLLKCIGEGIAFLGGVDNIIFSGSESCAFIPIIYSLVKKISFLGINTRCLPWVDKKEFFLITSKESKVNVYLNRMSLPAVIFYETTNLLDKVFCLKP